MKHYVIILLIGIVQISTCISQIAQPRRINGYYCWDVTNTNLIIGYELTLRECDSLQKIHTFKEEALKNELRVSDSIVLNLQSQIDASMEMIDLVNDQKGILKNDYDNLQKDYEKQMNKNNKQKKGISWLIGTGVAVLSGFLGISIYAAVK